MKIVYESSHSQLITCDQREYDLGRLDQFLAEQLLRGYVWYKMESSIQTKQMYVRTEFKAYSTKQVLRNLFVETLFA